MGLKRTSQLPKLIAKFLKLGLSKEVIEKPCSGNLFRLLQAVEDYAQSKRK